MGSAAKGIAVLDHLRSVGVRAFVRHGPRTWTRGRGVNRDPRDNPELAIARARPAGDPPFAGARAGGVGHALWALLALTEDDVRHVGDRAVGVKP